MNKMASQDIGGAVSKLQVLEIYSFVYHAYMEVWTPVMGEILVVKVEPTNSMIYMQWPSTEMPKL